MIALQLALMLASFGQRFVSGSEEEARLLTPKQQTVLVSPYCSETFARVKLRATIGPDGRVTSVKEVEQSSAHVGQDASKLGRLLQQAKRFVLGWRYHPMLVGGKPVSVKTFVYVRCSSQ